MSGSAGSATGQQRSAARLAAVQALYQIELNRDDAEGVILAFRTHGFPVEQGREAMVDPDVDLFADVVRGTTRRQLEIDRLLSETLVKGWPLERLESVLRAILRAGTYELLMRGDIPPKVIINEYIEIAHAFFSGDEIRMTNGVLDRVAHHLRSGDFDGGNDDRPAEAG